MIRADDAKVGELENGIHDPHNVRDNHRLRIEGRHQDGHVPGALVVGNDECAMLKVHLGLVAVLHHSVSGRVAPDGDHVEQPVVEDSLHFVVHLGVDDLMGGKANMKD